MRALAIGMKYFMIAAVTNCNCNCRLCVWLCMNMCVHMLSHYLAGFLCVEVSERSFLCYGSVGALCVCFSGAVFQFIVFFALV